MSLGTNNDSPIACTLGAGDYKSRLTWIAALNAEALVSARRDDLRLELSYAPHALDRVRQFVRQEQECCAFLNFEVREDAEAVRVSIEAPEGVRDAIEAVFEPFRSGAATAASCVCCAS